MVCSVVTKIHREQNTLHFQFEILEAELKAWFIIKINLQFNSETHSPQELFQKIGVIIVKCILKVSY